MIFLGSLRLNESNLLLVTPIRFVLVTDLCEQEPFPCESDTTYCKSSGGQSSCSCLTGFVSTLYTNKSCKGKTAHLQDGSDVKCVCLSKRFQDKLPKRLCFSCSVSKWMESSRFQLCAVSMRLFVVRCARRMHEFSKNLPF